MFNGKELEIINVTRTCDNEAKINKENYIAYENYGEKNTSITSKKKEKERGGCVCMYEFVKHFF